MKDWLTHSLSSWTLSERRGCAFSMLTIVVLCCFKGIRQGHVSKISTTHTPLSRNTCLGQVRFLQVIFPFGSLSSGIQCETQDLGCCRGYPLIHQHGSWLEDLLEGPFVSFHVWREDEARGERNRNRLLPFRPAGNCWK